MSQEAVIRWIAVFSFAKENKVKRNLSKDKCYMYKGEKKGGREKSG